MNVPAHLAASLLEADFENVCAKLKAGGTLTTAERAFLQKAAQSGPASPPSAVVAPSAAPPLTLTPEPSPASGDHGVTAAQLDAWADRYGTKPRQLRRWIARGIEHGEPCPLDQPAAMPAWIEKHLEKIRSDLRDRVHSAAERCATPAPAALAPSPTAPAPVSAPAPSAAALDLASVGGVEGESVQIFRDLFAAAKLQIQEAYKLGNEDKISKLHTRLEKVGESLRKHEAAAEIKAKRQGDLLEKAEVFNEVMQALNVMSRIEEQRADLVAADVPEMPPELAKKVRESLLRSGEKARALLRNLAVLRSPADVLLELAA